MFKQKQFSIIILCILVLSISLQLSGCRTIATSSDYPFYADEQSLFDHADLIINGVVIKVNKPEKINIRIDKPSQAMDDGKALFTVSEIKVTDVIKGNVKAGDIIKVKQLGDKNGRAEESEIMYDGYFEKGGQYILFLMDFTSMIADMPYSTLSPMQGQIPIVDGKIKIFESNPLFKSGIPKDEFVAELKTKIDKIKLAKQG